MRPDDCIAIVHDMWNSHQCHRKRGHGPGADYCKQHDPAAVEQRAKVSNERYDAARARERRVSVAVGLAHATVEQLRAELARREKP